MMRSLRCLMGGVALVASLVAVSSGSAANWDPQNTALTGTSADSALTDNAGNFVRCAAADVSLTATGDLATGRPTYSQCSSNLGPATVTTFGTWEYTAINTTTVSASATPTAPSDIVAGITIHAFTGTCHITVTGPVTIPGNTWSNANHSLTISSATQFELTQSASCFGLVGSTGFLEGHFTLPASATIT